MAIKGFDEEAFRQQIRDDLAKLPYQPMINPGTEIAVATLQVLTERFGPEFAQDVRSKIIDCVGRLDNSDDEKDRADAPLLRDLTEWPMWERLAAGRGD